MEDQQNQGAIQVIIQDLAKAVDSLSETSRTNKEVFKDVFVENQKRNEDLMHEVMNDHRILMREVIDDHKKLMHETMQDHRELTLATEKNHREDILHYEKTEHRLTAISVLVVCLSVIVGGYWSLKQQRLSAEKTELATLYKKGSWIDSKEINQTAIKNEFMIAGVNLRAIREEGMIYCKNGQYTGPDPVAYRQRLYSADYALLGASFKTTGIFNADIENQVRSFMSHSYSLGKNAVCTKDSPKDEDLRKKQNELNQLMMGSINELKNKKEVIVKKIEKLEKN